MALQGGQQSATQAFPQPDGAILVAAGHHLGISAERHTSDRGAVPVHDCELLPAGGVPHLDSAIGAAADGQPTVLTQVAAQQTQQVDQVASGASGGRLPRHASDVAEQRQQPLLSGLCVTANGGQALQHWHRQQPLLTP